MVTGPQRKFCEGIVRGDNATGAYRAAYPRSTAAAARRSASDLLTKPDIQKEIQRLRDKADKKAGSAVLSLIEKRTFLARLVRGRVGKLPPDSDLWNSIKTTEMGTEYRLPDKLAAIKLDNDLAGEGSEAGANDGLAELLTRIRK